MGLDGRPFSTCLLLLLLLAIALVLTPATTQLVPTLPVVQEDDVRCLRGLKCHFRDPNACLSSWTFANISAGAICDFSGVSCWHPQESQIIALELSDYGLHGALPSHLKYC
ncbi:hypothetical protein QYE76_060372 [Lolium multiflorum]|uniref:Leucine-rich repeat-containing N-terminal plant-type domain-containing protein n=1 Tax=Lolium multiflorum TaxID=4521 RepID=A0AAD8S215_LOLMU|nr:hypothetical protein QYE76_060372 [Lolium multiflorum]